MKRKTLLYGLRLVVIGLTILIELWFTIGVAYKLSETYVYVRLALSVIGIIISVSIMNKYEAAVYKMPWLIVFTAAPILGIILYLSFAVHLRPKKRDKTNNFINNGDGVPTLSDELSKFGGAVKYLETACSVCAYTDTDSEFLPTGEEYFKRLIEELNKAESYIFMEYFIIQQGKMFSAILNSLKTAAERGVKVYLVYDDVGSIAKVGAAFNLKLKKTGVNARVFRRFAPIVTAFHNNRDHRKITVIDGVVAFTGGVNLADEYINEIKPYGRWYDTGAVIYGGAVKEFKKAFIETYNACGKEKLCGDDFKDGKMDFAPANENGQKSASEFRGVVTPYFDAPYPVDDEHVGENLYLDLINRSDESLYITTPYFIVDTNIIEAIKRAVKRGVEVKIIIPEIPDKKGVYALTKSNAAILNDCGAEIYMFRGGFIHSKLLISDGKAYTVGTVNFDYRSFAHHFECGLFVVGASSVSVAEKTFKELINTECFKAGKKDLSLSFVEKIKKTLMFLFIPLM